MRGSTSPRRRTSRSSARRSRRPGGGGGRGAAGASEKARGEAGGKAVESRKEREVQERARQVFEMILKHRQEAGKAVEGITETTVMRAMEEKPTARDERAYRLRRFKFEKF